MSKVVNTVEGLIWNQAVSLKNLFSWSRSECGTSAEYFIYREQNDFLDIAYWLFFLYNRGKRACMGLFLWGRCFGIYSTFGHHVEDWEKVIQGHPSISR